MGRIVPRRDAAALAAAVLEVLDHKAEMKADPSVIRATYSPSVVAAKYLALFEELRARAGHR
jgi:glycosyltransferase involved in cell wall biosynthesis